MAVGGILGEDERVELLDGELVEMSPIGSRHAACVNRLNLLLVEALHGRAIVAVQNPVRLGAHSEPQPDVAVLRPRADYYAEGHPRPADILLLVEVAETSIDEDRDRKLPLYAAAGVAEVWIVDLASRVVDCFRRPSAAGYRLRQRNMAGDTLAPEAMPGVTIAVEDIMG
jgi:Uma2 family endonuclease